MKARKFDKQFDEGADISAALNLSKTKRVLQKHLFSDSLSLIESLKGKVVSHVWRGHGSALFLEFGALTQNQGKKRNDELGAPKGELSLMIEWSWRIERPRSILGGSWSSECRWPGMFKQLIGNKVSHVEIFGTLPEIAVLLSNGLRVVSFMTAEGQPSWALISPLKSLSVNKGILHVERYYAQARS